MKPLTSRKLGKYRLLSLPHPFNFHSLIIITYVFVSIEQLIKCIAVCARNGCIESID